MPATMGLNQLILFNAGWWVFATAAAFGAAILFWNKGAAQLSGSPVAGTSLAIKMSGAGALWGITLLLFWLIDPYKGWSDASRILLITTTAQEVPQGAGYASLDNDPLIVQALSEASRGDVLGVDLIYKKAIYSLEQETGNTFAFPDPIPAGYYELRVSNVTKQTRPVSRMIQVLPAAPVAPATPAASTASGPAAPSPGAPSPVGTAPARAIAAPITGSASLEPAPAPAPPAVR